MPAGVMRTLDGKMLTNAGAMATGEDDDCCCWIESIGRAIEVDVFHDDPWPGDTCAGSLGNDCPTPDNFLCPSTYIGTTVTDWRAAAPIPICAGYPFDAAKNRMELYRIGTWATDAWNGIKGMAGWDISFKFSDPVHVAVREQGLIPTATVIWVNGTMMFRFYLFPCNTVPCLAEYVSNHNCLIPPVFGTNHWALTLAPGDAVRIQQYSWWEVDQGFGGGYNVYPTIHCWYDTTLGACPAGWPLIPATRVWYKNNCVA